MDGLGEQGNVDSLERKASRMSSARTRCLDHTDGVDGLELNTSCMGLVDGGGSGGYCGEGKRCG